MLISSNSSIDTPAALCLPFEACATLCDALPRAQTLEQAMALIDSVRRACLGPGLLTVNLRADLVALQTQAAATTIELQRLWSSDPVAYPVAGRKRKTQTAWTRQLFERGEVFIGEGAAVLAEVFDDHARIAALGLRAVVNVPLLGAAGRCFATFNVLSPREAWQPQQLWLIRLLALSATPAISREAAQHDAENLA